MRTLTSKLARVAAAVVTLAVLATALPAPALAEGSGQVNINTASAKELALLPYVGDSVAARIVEHRTKNGNFKTVEDLMLVRGIGEKSFARLKPYVTVSGQTTLTAKVRSPRPTAPAAKAASR